MTCPQPEVAALDCEFPFLCGLGLSVIVSFAMVVILRYVCSAGAKPATLRVRRVRLNHKDDVGFEGSNVVRSRVWIIVSYLGELARVFEKVFGWPSSDGACWVSAGDNSGLIVKGFGQCRWPVCKVVWTLSKSVCVVVLLDRRRRSLFVSRDPSFSFSWTGERLDVTVLVLLSRAAGIAIWSRGTLPLSEVTLEHAASLPVKFLVSTTIRSLSRCYGFPWTIDELGRAVLVSEDDACLGDLGVHSLCVHGPGTTSTAPSPLRDL